MEMTVMVKAVTDGRYPVKVSGPLAGLVHEFRLELIGRDSRRGWRWTMRMCWRT